MRPVIALALLALLGCRDASEVAQPGEIAGAYALATIRGVPLPAEYPRGEMITSSRLVVTSAGTWTETRSAARVSGVQSTVYYGTWTETGNDVVFRVGPTTFYTGAVTSSGLRLVSDGAVLIYTRE